MTTLRYVTATFVLPDDRILLRRKRLGGSSVTQWQATAEWLQVEGESARAALNKHCMKDFNFATHLGPTPERNYQIHLVDTIKLNNINREITSYVIKILNMWKFRTSRDFEFHSKYFDDLLEDIYHNSVYSVGFVPRAEKHSSNTIHVIGSVDKRGIMRNGWIDF